MSYYFYLCRLLCGGCDRVPKHKRIARSAACRVPSIGCFWRVTLAGDVGVFLGEDLLDVCDGHNPHHTLQRQGPCQHRDARFALHLPKVMRRNR